MKTLSKTKKFPATPKVLRYGTITNSSCSQLSKQHVETRHASSLHAKCIIAFITLLSLVHFTLASYSQDLALNEEAREIHSREIENTTLIYFKAIYNTGNVYLKWTVKNETEDGLFIIERSPDNKNFKTIKFKQGIGVPICYPLLYCSTDEHPLQGTGYYRLIKIYQDGRYYYSDVVKLVTPLKTGDHSPEMVQKSIMNGENE